MTACAMAVLDAMGAVAVVLCGALGVCACPAVAPLRPELEAAASRQDALAVSDALEELIDNGRATAQDREAAYEAVRGWEEATAAYCFARGALAGRLAEEKGLTATLLIGEVERYARKSIALDPSFRDGAAKRMLGTLYVLAPAALLEHGDSEKGLQLILDLVRKYPDRIENHLRLGEAYLALGDPEPAHDPLCRCLAHPLRPGDRRLFDRLVQDLGGVAALECSRPR